MRKLQFSDLIALMFIILFTYAGWTKLLDYRSFRGQLASFNYISGGAGFLAIAMPLAHLGLALLLMSPKMRISALRISIALLLLYSVYIAVILLFSGNDIPCACGGLFRFTSWGGQLAINSLLIVCAFMAIIFQPNISHQTKV